MFTPLIETVGDAPPPAAQRHARGRRRRSSACSCSRARRSRSTRATRSRSAARSCSRCGSSSAARSRSASTRSRSPRANSSCSRVLAVPVVAVGGLGPHHRPGGRRGRRSPACSCSAVAFTLQLWGQRYVEPSRAAVILAVRAGRRRASSATRSASGWASPATSARSSSWSASFIAESRRGAVRQPLGARALDRAVKDALRMPPMSEPTRKPRAAFAPWDRRELPGIFTVEETGPPGRQLQVGRDAAVRGARRLGRHRARARREDGARPAHLSPRRGTPSCGTSGCPSCGR